MRLSSEFWVSAYLRQSEREGDFAGLIRKGAARGGAIFVIVNRRLDGLVDLYAPAPQSMLRDDTGERLFYRMLEGVDEKKVAAAIEKELRFDSDLWVIERESRSACHNLPLVDVTRR